MPLVILLVAMLSLTCARTAAAQAAVEFIPSASLFAVYDDNVYARVKGSAGQIQQLRPSFEGSYESPILHLLGLYSFDMQRSNFSSLNSLDARRHALSEFRMRTTPFTTIGVAGRYDRSDSPGDINVDTGVIGARRTAERFELNPSYLHRLDPHTGISAAYNFTTEHLIDGEYGTLHVGRLGASRDISTRTNLAAAYVARYFVDHIADQVSNAILLGWNRTLAPGTRVSLFAGPRYSRYRGLEPEASASFAHTTPHVMLAIDYTHGETIVLGVQGPVANDSVSSRITWPFRRRFEFGVLGGASNVSTLDHRTMTVYHETLVGSWSPGGIYTIATSYGFDYQTGSIRNQLFLDGGRLILDDRVLRQVFRVSVTVAPRYRRSVLPPDEAARAKGVTR
jgi:hypothetical protein